MPLPTSVGQYGVQKLAVFGSAVTETWDPVHSDLDLVMEFDGSRANLVDRFIGFADALETLFHRPGDLVFFSKLTRPGFREEVLETMELLIDEPERAGNATAA
jgi:predicted nucleotidyltransferase